MSFCVISNIIFSELYYSEVKNIREANEIYDAIKEGGSTQILGHLMRVPASSYFFTLLHLRKV